MASRLRSGACSSASPTGITSAICSWPRTFCLLGKHKKKGGYNWDGWRGLNEEDFLDITLGPINSHSG
jgi:hypothetical protein